MFQKYFWSPLWPPLLTHAFKLKQKDTYFGDLPKFLLFFTSLILEPNSYYPCTQASHFSQLFFHQGIWTGVCTEQSQLNKNVSLSNPNPCVTVHQGCITCSRFLEYLVAFQSKQFWLFQLYFYVLSPMFFSGPHQNHQTLIY